MQVGRVGVGVDWAVNLWNTRSEKGIHIGYIAVIADPKGDAFKSWYLRTAHKDMISISVLILWKRK